MGNGRCGDRNRLPFTRCKKGFGGHGTKAKVSDFCSVIGKVATGTKRCVDI